MGRAQVCEPSQRVHPSHEAPKALATQNENTRLPDIHTSMRRGTIGTQCNTEGSAQGGNYRKNWGRHQRTHVRIYKALSGDYVLLSISKTFAAKTRRFARSSPDNGFMSKYETLGDVSVCGAGCTCAVSGLLRDQTCIDIITSSKPANISVGNDDITVTEAFTICIDMLRAWRHNIKENSKPRYTALSCLTQRKKAL